MLSPIEPTTHNAKSPVEYGVKGQQEIGVPDSAELKILHCSEKTKVRGSDLWTMNETPVYRAEC